MTAYEAWQLYGGPIPKEVADELKAAENGS